MNALACARGVWQKDIVRAMSDRGAVSPVHQLRGKAAKYGIHYRSSFQNLCKRLEAQGYTVNRQPGKRGGEPTAIYWIEG